MSASALDNIVGLLVSQLLHSRTSDSVINYQDRFGNTALHIALMADWNKSDSTDSCDTDRTESYRQKLVRILVRAGANPILANNRCMTCSHMMLESSNDEAIVEEIFKYKTETGNLDCIDEFGTTPLQRAANMNNLFAATKLVQHGADVNYAIHHPSMHNEALLTDGGRGTWKLSNFTPLHIAASRGFVDIVKILMDNGADPNGVEGVAGGANVVQIAAASPWCKKTGSFEGVMDLLQGYGVSMQLCSKEGKMREPLVHALTEGRVRNVAYFMKLLEKGSICGSKVPIIHLAVQNLNFGPDIIVYLFSEGFCDDVNELWIDTHGKQITPLKRLCFEKIKPTRLRDNSLKYVDCSHRIGKLIDIMLNFGWRSWVELGFGARDFCGCL
ncbi:hypothetical protein QAD02_013691 [Eretmocerus hayati]|uniref:Uncharacterized protein n=1 Tax=Eretmocerus hayati TaxID=131215 RepID=A0ACC2P2V3_9HYME|nr:hypothetical protein QAD02_013691 [Eretmocerus hayati]